MNANWAVSGQAAALDHLVVMAGTLAQGVTWCEAAFGIRPGPGGEHPLMGTHNRLFRIDSSAFARAYLEIIAINPDASCQGRAGARRWFDMDDPVLRQQVAQTGPRLIHCVAATPDIHAAVQTLATQGIQRGPVLAASRLTAGGLLQWQICVRDDGQRLFDGCLPTLIQWGDVHPTDSMPASGVTLLSLQVSHPEATALQAAYLGIGLKQVTAQPGPARLSATFQTPKGILELHS